MKTNDDYLQEIHDEYTKQVLDSGLPLWLSDIYSQGSYKAGEKCAAPLYSYRLFWTDEFNDSHEQVSYGYNMYEAMSFIENQAMQFGYKTCQFTKVEIWDDDPDHPLPSDKHDGDLPF